MTGNLGTAFRWLASRPGYMLLAADDEKLAAAPPQRFARAWVELVLLSLGWGILSVGLWGVALKFVGDYYSGIPFMPVAAVVAPMTLWLYRRSLLALAESLVGADPAGKAVGGAVIVVVIVLSLLGLEKHGRDWPFYLPPAWQWVCPMAPYRVLIVAPVWGAWAMLITCQFCRSRDHTEPAVAAFARGCGPVAAAACLAPLLAATLLYFHFLGVWRLIVPAAAVVAAVAGGLLLCRASGGLRRRALLAVNMLTQIVFFLAYLANR